MLDLHSCDPDICLKFVLPCISLWTANKFGDFTSIFFFFWKTHSIIFFSLAYNSTLQRVKNS